MIDADKLRDRIYGECSKHGRYARIAPCCPQAPATGGEEAPDPFDDCLSIHVGANAKRLASLPTTEQSLAGEAVAWMYEKNGGRVIHFTRTPEYVTKMGHTETPLYATPQPAPAMDEKAIRHDERRKIIAQGCIHTRKAAEQNGDGDRPDIVQWQEDGKQWFDATICEIVSEYAAWRDAQSAPVTGEGACSHETTSTAVTGDGDFSVTLCTCCGSNIDIDGPSI